MCLSEREICVSYKQAADKTEQLTVIHELTLLPKSKIAEILQKNGIECVYKNKIYRSKNGTRKGYKEFKFNTVKTKELYDRGLLDKEIAPLIGVSKQSITHWRTYNKLEDNFSKKMATLKEQIPVLLQQGYTIEKAAKALGISQTTIYNFKREIKKAAQLAL